MKNAISNDVFKYEVSHRVEEKLNQKVNFSNVVLCGNVGSIKFGSFGSASDSVRRYCSLSLAINYGEKFVSWFDLVCFDSDLIDSLLTISKGDFIQCSCVLSPKFVKVSDKKIKTLSLILQSYSKVYFDKK